MSTTTIVLTNGLRVRTASARRYIVVATRSPESPNVLSGADESFAVVLLRTDNIATARTKARRYGWIRGAHAEVYSRLTGEKVG